MPASVSGLEPGKSSAPSDSPTNSPRLLSFRLQTYPVRVASAPVLPYLFCGILMHLDPYLLLAEIAFHFRKGDQPEGVNFYTLSTPGSSPPAPVSTFRVWDAKWARFFPGRRLASLSSSRLPRSAATSSRAPLWQAYEQAFGVIYPVSLSRPQYQARLPGRVQRNVRRPHWR